MRVSVHAGAWRCNSGIRHRESEVADVVIATLKPIRERCIELAEDPGWLDQMLRQGAQKVLPIAFATLDKVKRLTGIELSQPDVNTITRNEGVH